MIDDGATSFYSTRTHAKDETSGPNDNKIEPRHNKVDTITEERSRSADALSSTIHVQFHLNVR